ncbi:Dual specificity protein phosphatase 22-A-like protein [Aix galericulata]|nr:Dual specificity protein phosphatase 22-A-like protein [Aix galericulata]
MQHFKECIKFIHDLAGVSRSTTVLVAYLMTVTELGWERCLAATRAARSYASPNPGFQQQLRDYESTLLDEEAEKWNRGAGKREESRFLVSIGSHRRCEISRD